jgi:hypothetical protein
MALAIDAAMAIVLTTLLAVTSLAAALMLQ